MTHNTLIYDIRRFACKDIYPDTLLFSVIHFVLLLGQSVFRHMCSCQISDHTASFRINESKLAGFRRISNKLVRRLPEGISWFI
jgi:hypothetical protein